MALSETALRVLTEASQHPLRLAAPPDKLPTAACRAVLNNLLKQGYVEECEAPVEYIGLGWRRPDGVWTAVRATEAGLLAIGAASATTTVDKAEEDAEQDAARSASCPPTPPRSPVARR